MRLLLLALFSVCLFAGCREVPPLSEPSPSSTPTVAVTPPPSPVPTVIPLATATPSPTASLAPTATPTLEATTAATPMDPQIVFAGATPVPKMQRASRRMSSIQENGHGQVGLMLYAGNGIYANRTIYPDLIVPTPPPGDTALNTLAALTMKPPGACLEFAPLAWAGAGTGGVTTHSLQIGNFCTNTFYSGPSVPIDAAFMVKYVRDFKTIAGQTLPQFTSEVVYVAGVGTYAAIYNYATSKWELFYFYPDSTPSSNGSGGWLIFEAAAWDETVCAGFPLEVASNIAIFVNGVWIAPTPTNAQITDTGVCSIDTTIQLWSPGYSGLLVRTI